VVRGQPVSGRTGGTPEGVCVANPTGGNPEGGDRVVGPEVVELVTPRKAL
jgi:hypothetical protein